MRTLFVALLVGLTALAGCLADGPSEDLGSTTPAAPAAERDLRLLVNATALAAVSPMVFLEQVVTAAVQFTNDLYEPTIDVSDTGVIYITGHTILVDTTGAPVFFSRDDGTTWAQLPFFDSLTMPGPVHGATPPPSDEIFLVAGDDGWLYGVDITLATFPVNMWSGDGARLAYHNPNAYDESQVPLQTSASCIPRPVKDRPWAAYANGTLLLVNNPAGDKAQIGVTQVPPALPGAVGSAADSIQWNLCAGPGGSIPGIPDIRNDGQFAVPQRSGGALHLVLGNKANIMDVEIKEVFKHTSGGEITSVYGHAVFDANGTLFVGITNNTAPDADNIRHGQLNLAVSLDAGQSFVNHTFSMGPGTIRHIYMDGNKQGEGALVVWAVDGETTGRADWYVAHLHVGADGGPELRNAFLAIDEGPRPSAHVTGAAIGPDGRAYLATYLGGPPGGTPLSVWVQQDGPVLPVFA